MRANKIHVFYNPKQVLQSDTSVDFSKSPSKPKKLIEYIDANDLLQHFRFTDKFRPFSNNEFRIAHTKEYVDSFFKGTELAQSNSLTWSEQFANSVRYTSASLYEAIRNSVANPDEVSVSPTSGFHHAHPGNGAGFCTFSGQVIASVKLWRNHGLVGCYLDLDGHYGNSIEDARKFQPAINNAVPVGFNFNPQGHDKKYLKSLIKFLTERLQPAILNGSIDYVVWCHGADSHSDDDMHGQCSTEYWLKCSKFFWKWVKQMDEILGRSLPVSCALFGGYRSDDYQSVLSLHTMDLVKCMKHLLELDVKYEPQIKVRYVKAYDALRYPAYTPYSRQLPPAQNRSYVCSTDLGARRQEREAERDRLNEEEFEKFYRIRINSQKQ
jgi:acetoin utilization deacetylase AcuC-like enzyme